MFLTLLGKSRISTYVACISNKHGFGIMIPKLVKLRQVLRRRTLTHAARGRYRATSFVEMSYNLHASLDKVKIKLLQHGVDHNVSKVYTTNMCNVLG